MDCKLSQDIMYKNMVCRLRKENTKIERKENQNVKKFHESEKREHQEIIPGRLRKAY
jgi:hypothetical protein